MKPEDLDPLQARWIGRLTQAAIDLKEGEAPRASHTRSKAYRFVDRILDRRLGTGREVSTLIDHFHPEHTIYQPSGWTFLPRALRPWEIGREDVFADLGCGRGRVVYIAARWYRFRRVVGVDISPELIAHAEEMVARDRSKLRCKDVELVCANAHDWRVPDDVTVVYLYYPFLGATLAAFVASLEASLKRRPRRIRVLYAAPRQTKLLTRGNFRRVRTSRMPGDHILHRIEIFESLPPTPRPRPVSVMREAISALRAIRRKLRADGLIEAHRSVPTLSSGYALEPLVRLTLRFCRATCLERALIAQAWRASHGDARDLVIGVKLSAGEFAAHAWLVGFEHDHEFRELMCLPPPTRRAP